MKTMARKLLALGSVRYVAILRDGELYSESKPGLAKASSAESDKYEELLVNPTLVKLLGQRGDIDCGGLEHVVIRYGHFFQVIVPAPWGHISVSVEASGDPRAVARRTSELLRSRAFATGGGPPRGGRREETAGLPAGDGAWENGDMTRNRHRSVDAAAPGGYGRPRAGEYQQGLAAGHRAFGPADAARISFALS